jgi:hypothetical protein
MTRFIRLLALVIVLVSSVGMAQSSETMIGDPGGTTTTDPCPSNQCTYGSSCYSQGACLHGQRCSNNYSGGPTWVDDAACPKAVADQPVQPVGSAGAN